MHLNAAALILSWSALRSVAVARQRALEHMTDIGDQSMHSMKHELVLGCSSNSYIHMQLHVSGQSSVPQRSACTCCYAL